MLQMALAKEQQVKNWTCFVHISISGEMIDNLCSLENLIIAGTSISDAKMLNWKQNWLQIDSMLEFGSPSS